MAARCTAPTPEDAIRAQHRAEITNQLSHQPAVRTDHPQEGRATRRMDGEAKDRVYGKVPSIKFKAKAHVPERTVCAS